MRLHVGELAINDLPTHLDPTPFKNIARNTYNGLFLWEKTFTGESNLGQIAADEDFVYVGNGKTVDAFDKLLETWSLNMKWAYIGVFAKIHDKLIVAADANKFTHVVYAFEIGNKTSKWKLDLPKGTKVKRILKGSNQAFLSASNMFYGITLNSGVSIGSHPTRKRAELKLVDEQNIYAGTTEKLTAYNKKNGNVSWSTTYNTEQYGKPLYFQKNGGLGLLETRYQRKTVVS